MTMQMVGKKAQALAEELAAHRKVSVGEAVEQALEAELKRETERRALAGRLHALAGELASLGAAGGREMTKDEVDEMWGH